MKQQREREECEVVPKDIDIKGVTYWRVRLGKRWTGDKSLSRVFKEKEAAYTFISQQRIIRTNQGAAGFSLDDSQRVDAAAAIKLIDSKLSHIPTAERPSLKMLAEDYIQRHAPNGQVTVKEAVRVFLLSRANKSPSYLEAITRDLRLVEEQWGEKPLHEITTAQVREFLQTPRWAKSTKNQKRKPFWSERTKRNLRISLAALWAHGCKDEQGWVAKTGNVVLKIDPKEFKVIKERPGIVDVQQARSLLVGAEEHLPDLLPFFAIGLFTGLRRSEILGLSWAQIDFDNREIEVSGAISKNDSWRAVQMSDNLIEWLRPYRKSKGPVVPWHDLELGKKAIRHTATLEGHRRRALMKKIGLAKIPRNALRHSCATYLLARTMNAAATALEMGHSERILKTNYRAPARKAAAEAFFTIVPEPKSEPKKSDSKIVQMVAACKSENAYLG